MIYMRRVPSHSLTYGVGRLFSDGIYTTSWFLNTVNVVSEVH